MCEFLFSSALARHELRSTGALETSHAGMNDGSVLMHARYFVARRTCGAAFEVVYVMRLLRAYNAIPIFAIEQ
jgi:hypothetical protein